MNEKIPLILTVVPVLILLCAAWGDLRRRTIEHWIVIAIAVLAPLFWWSRGLPLLPDVAWGQPGWIWVASLFEPASIATIIVISLIMLGFFTLFFAIGWMGGGDVKLLAALSLWMFPWNLPWLLIIEALAGVVITILAAIHHQRAGKDGKTEVPRGIAIAFAGIWVLVERYLNHFA